MTQQNPTERHHELFCSVIRDCQLNLLNLSEREDYKSIWTVPEFSGYKTKALLNRSSTQDDFSTWNTDGSNRIKPRISEGLQDVKVNKEKARRGAWRTEGKSKEIRFVFRHYPDPQQYIEQYRRGYTFHNFTSLRNGSGDSVRFVSLSRLPWSDKIQKRQKLPPNMVSRIFNSGEKENDTVQKVQTKSTTKMDRKDQTTYGVHRPSSSHPNSANNKNLSKTTKHKPSLVDLQHKYKLDPNAIKNLVPDKECNVNGPLDRSAIPDSRDSSVKSSQLNDQSGRDPIKQMQNIIKMERKGHSVGPVFGVKTTKFGFTGPQQTNFSGGKSAQISVPVQSLRTVDLLSDVSTGDRQMWFDSSGRAYVSLAARYDPVRK